MQSLQEVTVGLLAELHYTELHDPYSGNGPGERREGGGPRVPRSSSRGVRGSRGLTEHGFSQGQCTVQFSSVQSLSCVQVLAIPWTAALQASLSITNSQSLFKLMSTESVMPSNHLILCCPLLEEMGQCTLSTYESLCCSGHHSR